VIKERDEGCATGCAGCHGCGAAVQAEIIAQNSLAANPGDRVYIEHDGGTIHLSFIVFGLPIVLPLICYFAGVTLDLSPPLRGCAAVLGLLAAIMFMRFYNKKIAAKPPGMRIVGFNRGQEE
jgi:positive regulator of sigma E activity